MSRMWIIQVMYGGEVRQLGSLSNAEGDNYLDLMFVQIAVS